MKSLSLAFVLVLGLALTGCGRNLFQKTYHAMAVIEVRPRTEASMPGLNGIIIPPPYDPAPFLAEIKDMLSDTDLAPVIQKLKLDQIWAKRFRSDHDTLSPQEALDHLHKVLEIKNPRGTSILEIIAFSEIPQEAADVANAVADAYKTRRDQENALRNKHDLDDLNNKIASQSQLVADKEASAARIPAAANAQRELEEQQNVLDVLNNHLKQLVVDQALQESPVRIISHAEVPTE